MEIQSVEFATAHVTIYGYGRKKIKRNSAYIDGANLHNGVRSSGWKIHYRRFRVWLKDKYQVDHAYIFLGFIEKNKHLYTHLEKVGFDLVFKETVYDDRGRIKGNGDADLVLEMVRGAYENRYTQAILVSSDGDYARLVKFLLEKNKFKVLLSPSTKCSMLLYRTKASITFLDEEYKKIA